MRKEEFLRQLDYLLQDVPAEDREEAMAYYRDYLDEAGPEQEEAAIESFGSPERAAALIRADLAGNLKDKDHGFFTETGYEDERYRDPNYQVAKRLDLPEERESEHHQNRTYNRDPGYGPSGDSRGYEPYHGPYEEGTYRETYNTRNTQPVYHEEPKKPWTNKLLKWILVAILLVVASPLIIGGVSVFGVALMVVVGGILLLALGSIGLFLFSLAAMVVAIIMAFTIPIEGFLILGGALVGFGCSILGLLCVYGILFVLCPWTFRALKKLITTLMDRRKEANA